MDFKNYWSMGKCDVCGKEKNVVVCASTMGPYSYAYCEDCLMAGAEPYGTMVAYISCAGHFPKDINDVYQNRVRRSLNYLGKTEGEFIKDVDSAIIKTDECFNIK